MSLAEKLATILQAKGLATLGTNLHISVRTTASQDQDDQWVILSRGGNVTGGNIRKWRQEHLFEVRYYHRKARSIYEAEQSLIQALALCESFNDSPIIEAIVSPLRDEDESNQEIRVGSWDITLVTIKE